MLRVVELLHELQVTKYEPVLFHLTKLTRACSSSVRVLSRTNSNNVGIDAVQLGLSGVAIPSCKLYELLLMYRSKQQSICNT